MCLFKPFFKVLSLYLEARIRIRIRIKVKGRIRIRIKDPQQWLEVVISCSAIIYGVLGTQKVTVDEHLKNLKPARRYSYLGARSIHANKSPINLVTQFL
jgi:hypothetical protein